jgi:chromate transporter
MSGWDLFWMFLKSALFSTSGTGNLPMLHTDLLANGWATESMFAEALAIGQLSPGPTGLWVLSLAYLIDGVRGATLALVAIALPPLTAIGVHAVYLRYGAHPAVQGFVRGLVLAVASMFVVVLLGIMAQNGINVQSLAIALFAVVATWRRSIPVPVVLLIAGIAGIMNYEL